MLLFLPLSGPHSRCAVHGHACLSHGLIPERAVAPCYALPCPSPAAAAPNCCCAAVRCRVNMVSVARVGTQPKTKIVAKSITKSVKKEKEPTPGPKPPTLFTVSPQHAPSSNVTLCAFMSLSQSQCCWLQTQAMHAAQLLMRPPSPLYLQARKSAPDRVGPIPRELKRTAGKKVVRRAKPGVVALREIRQYQKVCTLPSTVLL